MRKLVIVLMAVLAVSVTALAQESSHLKMNIFGGLGAGYGSYEVDNLAPGESGKSMWSAAHLIFGAKAQYYLNESFSVTGGLSYARKGVGYKVTDSSETATAEGEIWASYLEIPATLRIGTGFYVGFGGYLAFQLGSSHVKDTVQDIDRDVDDGYQNKTNYGLVLEMGFEFSDSVEFGLQWDMGLKPMVEDNSQKNTPNSLLFVLGIKFDM